MVLAVAVLAGPAHAQPRWTLIRSQTLTVIGDHAGTVRDVATEIEQFREVVGRLVGTTRPPTLPTVVYVFGTRKAMEPYLPLYNGRPLAVAGFYSPDRDVNRIIMTAEQRETSTAVAYHEYTHLLLGNAVRGMPVWLGEGVAEYFSTFRMTLGGRSAEAGHPIAWHILLLRERWVPIMELLDTQHSSKLYNEGDRRTIFYAESWALTHFILSQLPNGRSAINTYISRVNAGASPAEAVSDAFGMTPAELESRVRQYVRREVFSMMRYEMSQRVTVEKPTPPLTLTAAEADAWLGDLQRRSRGAEAAAARIEAAAARAPDVAVVQMALGRLRGEQQRPDDARTALARAARLAPDDYMMQLAHGMWLAHSGGGMVVADADAVASLRRAVALNAESPDALSWLALNLMTSVATRGEARAAIERAITLAPGRLDYVVYLADMYLLEGLDAPARALLKDVAAKASDDVVRAGAESRLANLAQRDQRLAQLAAEREERVAAARSAAAAAAAATAVTAAPNGAGDPARPGGATLAPERSNVVRLSELRGAFAATRLVHAGTGEVLTLMMRRPQAGEERVFVTLTNVECRQGPEIRFHAVGGTTPIVTSAGRFPDVELTAFRPGELLLACGRRSPADRVALTFKPNTNTPGIAGTAIALEFLPDGYGPAGSRQ